MKTKIKNELTKKRSIKNKKVKKALFVIFLLFVDCYIIFNITNQIKANWKVEITAVNAENKVTILRSDNKSQAGVSASLNVKGGDNTPPSIEDKIKNVFGDEWKTAIAVAKCESRLDPNRIGDKHLSKPSVGLFQINQIWHNYSTKELKDPMKNIEIAKKIRDDGGWNRWSCYRLGYYKKFLN